MFFQILLVVWVEEPPEDVETVTYRLHVVRQLRKLLLLGLHVRHEGLNGTEKELVVRRFGAVVHSEEHVFLTVERLNEE